MNDQQGLAITSAGTVVNHLHGGLTLVRRGAADSQQLPTVYLLDVKALLRTSADIGLAVIPWRDGEPRAFVLAATAPMRHWVIDQLDTGEPLWLPALAPDGAGLLQSQLQDASLGEAP